MSQISHKKATRSEQRRNALKEYYRLQKQEKELEETTKVVRPLEQEQDHNETADVPPEIDIEECDFKTLITETNKLSTGINSINSTTKNIVYNNYYELIKLNDFLGDLNELNLSAVRNRKKSVMDILGPTGEKSDVPGIDPFEKLRSLMDKIEQHEHNSYSQSLETPGGNGITSLLAIRQQPGLGPESQAYKSKLKSTIGKWIEELDTKRNESLIHQLQEVYSII